MSIFKAYDIRGIYPSELDEQTAYNIGRSLIVLTRARRVLVGEDARIHSPRLRKELIRGLTDQGADVVFTGMCSTPMLHFLGHDFDISIMVTASHNPKEYNGFKMYRRKGMPINYDTGIKDIEELFRRGVFSQERKGTVMETNLRPKYFDYVAQRAKGDYSGMSVILDLSNGSTYEAAKEILQRLNVDYRLINEQPDGNFPNHDPNPLKPETHVQLSQELKKHKADFGVIFDGDGDRAVFLDEKGNLANADSIKIMIGEAYLKTQPGAGFVFDLFVSRWVKEKLEGLGGKVVISRVGYSFIFMKMGEIGAAYGAELSGHMFYKELDNVDSAVFSTLTLLRVLKEQGKPLSELSKEHEKYVTTEVFNYKVADVEEALRRVESGFRKGRIEHIDGVSVDVGDVWFTLRPSNTEPIIKLRLEGRSKARVLAVRKVVEKLISGKNQKIYKGKTADFQNR